MGKKPEKPLSPERWTQSRFADFIGVDAAIVSRALSRGILTRGADWITWNRELHHWHAENAAGRSGDDEINLVVERAKLARAQTEKIRMELKKARGEFVSVPAICLAIVQINSIIRSKILQLASRIKSEVPELATKGVAVVEKLACEALEELANQRLPRDVVLKMKVINDAAFNKEIIPEKLDRSKGRKQTQNKRKGAR